MYLWLRLRRLGRLCMLLPCRLFSMPEVRHMPPARSAAIPPMQLFPAMPLCLEITELARHARSRPACRRLYNAWRHHGLGCVWQRTLRYIASFGTPLPAMAGKRRDLPSGGYCDFPRAVRQPRCSGLSIRPECKDAPGLLVPNHGRSKGATGRVRRLLPMLSMISPSAPTPLSTKMPLAPGNKRPENGNLLPPSPADKRRAG